MRMWEQNRARVKILIQGHGDAYFNLWMSKLVVVLGISSSDVARNRISGLGARCCVGVIFVQLQNHSWTHHHFASKQHPHRNLDTMSDYICLLCFMLLPLVELNFLWYPLIRTLTCGRSNGKEAATVKRYLEKVNSQNRISFMKYWRCWLQFFALCSCRNHWWCEQIGFRRQSQQNSLVKEGKQNLMEWPSFLGRRPNAKTTVPNRLVRST